MGTASPRTFLVPLAIASALGLGCGSKGTSSPTTPTATATPTPTATPTGGVSSIAGCEVTISSPGTPLVSDPKSPYYDHLGLASTADGASALGYREVLSHASAPDGTRLPDGSVGVYYNSGETGGVWLARVSGSGLVPVSPVTLDGVLRPQWMADVDVTLVDGKVRMIYLNGEGGTRRFCVAESTDGVSFHTVSLAIRFPGTEADPTVVRLDDGTWLMAFSRANHTGIGFARSGDGLSFTEFSSATFGAVPELSMAEPGRVRLYVCTGGNVESYTSTNAGAAWSREGVVIRSTDVGRRIVCDPTLVGGERTFVFKVTDA